MIVMNDFRCHARLASKSLHLTFTPFLLSHAPHFLEPFMPFILSPALRSQASRPATCVLVALAASPAISQSNVEKCATKLGTLSVIEAPAGYGYLSSYGLGSPAALLRLMIQQSDCFDVVERGAAFSSLQQERALAGAGELQQGSNLGQGQLQAADFVMTPNVQVSGNTGGLGGSSRLQQALRLTTTTALNE